MKFFVPLICCLALARALPGGQSVSSRQQDDHGNYQFGYDIVDEHGAQNGRQEKGDAHGNKVGSYTIKDNDGRSRRVDYVADAHGFRASIATNEPGTASSHTGDATYLSSAPIITAEPVKLLAAAPAYSSPIYAAPAQLGYGPAPLLKSYSAPLAYAAPAPLLRSYSAPLLTKSYSAPLAYAPAPLAYASDPWTKAW